MGYCETATKSSEIGSSSSSSDSSDANGNSDVSSSFVTEPPLGPRPDLIDDTSDDLEEEYSEYTEEDEIRCQVVFIHGVIRYFFLQIAMVKWPEKKCPVLLDFFYSIGTKGCILICIIFGV